MTNETNIRLDWATITANLDKEGYALLPKFMDQAQVKALTASALESAKKSQKQPLDKLGLGSGTLWRLVDILSPPLPAWQAELYEQLAPIANRWNEEAGLTLRYPKLFSEFLSGSRQTKLRQSTAALSRLGANDYQALHQSAEGAPVFPLQLVVLMSEPGRDFTGGEFVMTEQRPRMQSRPMVLPLKLGDAALITVSQRPFKGSKGYYRVNMKHAISRVRSGERLGLEMLFHAVPELQR